MYKSILAEIYLISVILWQNTAVYGEGSLKLFLKEFFYLYIVNIYMNLSFGYLSCIWLVSSL